MTNDSDFGDLIVREGMRHNGVILFRLRTTRLQAKQGRLEYVIATHGKRLDEFLVVTDGRVRFRR